MDPKATYVSMNDSMHKHEYTDAREFALALREWFDNGGFCPDGMDRAAIMSRVGYVLRETGLSRRVRRDGRM